jgi:rhodanese-related sulfurtransferase
MPSFTVISSEKLARLVGTPKAPVIIDVRTDEDFSADARLLPGAVRRSFAEAPAWAAEFAGRTAVVICQRGLKLSHGAAAWLRHCGVPADVLEGGFEAWKDASLPLLPDAKLPRRDAAGRTVWVTRARPKVDRIACPWLIRRFVDPGAVFLFVPPAEVAEVAARFSATPFDIDGAHFGHRGNNCTFDALLDEFDLATEPLLRLSAIVRGADTARLDLAPEAPGLLAASLGLSRMYSNDLEQLEAGLLLHDAFYRWCRDASEETHSSLPKKRDIPARRTRP